MRAHEALRGSVIGPSDADYDEARKIWNAMIDKRPSLIARCADAADVARAVVFARENDLVVAVKGGGHNVAGHAVCDDGLVIDLSRMKSVAVDSNRRTARAGGGATWGDYDEATQAVGLASPGGVVSTTGIAGLTLGGGVGWLSRSYGLACDNLTAAEVVTANGDVVTASAEQNPDLFWGLRGGGGNFGIVTTFEYRLHPVTELLAGIVIHPRKEARDFLRVFRDVVAEASDELACFAGLLPSPDGEPLVAAFVAYHGDTAEGERVVKPLRQFGSPIVDDIGPKPYLVVQGSLDDGFPSGKRHYWKSSALSGLDDELLDVLIEWGNRAPSPLSAIGIEEQLGGAVSRVGREETAFGLRDVEHNLGILAIWDDPSKDEANVQWARDLWAEVQPFSTGSVYVNYLNFDEEQRIDEAYTSAQYRRLAQLKNRYDPTNLFRRNQNVPPSG